MRRISRLLAPLRSRDFTLIWLGQSISQVGDAASSIALVWLLVGITGSSLLLGSVLTVAYIPTLLLLLLGGALADRFSGRVVALICDGLRAVVAAVFAALVILRMITLPEVFVFAAISGLVSAFFNPALGALYPMLVDPERYDAAMSLRQITTQVATLGGPALAGYLIAQWNVGAALAFDAATFAVSFLALTLARGRAIPQKAQAPDVSATPAASRWREMFAGVRFLRGEPSVFILILVFSLTNGLNDVVQVLTPRLARVTLHLPATAFGLFYSSMGVGALLGAFAIGMVSSRLRWRAQLICASLFVFGGSIVAMGLARDTLTLDIAFAVFGVSFVVPEVIFGALLQRIIPAEMRGRVYSVLGLIAMSMNPAGLFLAGALGDTVGPRAGLWIGGGAIAALAVVAILIPGIRALNNRGAPAEAIPALATAPVEGDARRE